MNKVFAGIMVIGVFGMATSFGGVPVTTELIKQRGLVSQGNPARLLAVLDKARRGEPVTIAAIGGSITAGGARTKDPENRYINRMAAWFTKTFPKCKIKFINAGIGGTNSYYGAMRIHDDVLSQTPDLVVVEYAVNNPPGRDYAESYEGVLRQLLREPQKIAVVELFFMHRKGENSQDWQEMLGRQYQLPMISFRDAWWPEFSSGRAVWEDAYDDIVHPKDMGHILASDLLIALLDAVNRMAQPGVLPPSVNVELPPPMISDVFANCIFSQYGKVNPTGQSGWSRPAGGGNWESSAPKSFIEFEFTGRVISSAAGESNR